MKQTMMAYMVATIVSFAVIGGLIMAPISSMAQGQQIQQNSGNQAQDQGQQDNQAQSRDQQDTRTPTTTAACGQVVEGLVELNSNLNCSGDGLIVGGDDTTIRLNGHTIMGPGPDSSKVGVSVGNQDGVRIEGPGTIEQFQAGILASGAEGTMISEMILEDNQIAIFSTGTEGLQAMQNIITRNSIGMASHSSNGLELRENLLTGNVLAGITFVATGESLVSTNNVIESENGIFVDPQSSDNRIESNNVLRNKVDLNNANGLATNVNQNGYSDNNCQISNPSGLCIGR
ncbi:MAG: right-handed parallel beta-helix repeat-containing protein [Thermoproteota archaeon]|nr:right-handed parallel beta-helix repeat-containing protein [Thermoproteota archaeon]